MAWCWFLAQTFPTATIRLVGPSLDALNLFSPPVVSRTSALCGYRFTLLAGFFHDLKRFGAADANASVLAASWLGNVQDLLLIPFREWSNVSSWDAWTDGSSQSHVRLSRSLIFDRVGRVIQEHRGGAVNQWADHCQRVAETVRSQGAVPFWQELCGLFQLLAQDPKLSRYRQPLEQVFAASTGADS